MRRLAMPLARLRLLDAVIDTVPKQVIERILHLFEDPPVDFDVVTANCQLHLLALIARQLPRKPRIRLQQR